jgi:steroid delta-isomerase-like uncharacterized protein
MNVHERNKEIVRRLYEEATNTGELALVDEVVAPDYVGAQGLRGPAGFRATIEALRRGVPDVRFTVVDLVGEGERVAVRWSWTGTHDGTLFGIPPSHRAITNDGVAIYEFRGGLVAAAWVLTDRLAVLQQIDVVPQNPGVPAAAE